MSPKSSNKVEPKRMVLASADPLFLALCRGALDEAGQPLLAAVAPAQLLETVRRLGPELLVLDADGEDVATLKQLATKVMLVSEARLVLVSAYLSPGSPGLSALLQSIAASFVQKPQGPSSLSLAEEDGPAFVAALLSAPVAAAVPAPAPAGPRPRSATIPPVDIDAGWDSEDKPS
jgi:chemotaxis response regulator CheB